MKYGTMPIAGLIGACRPPLDRLLAGVGLAEEVRLVAVPAAWLGTGGGAGNRGGVQRDRGGPGQHPAVHGHPRGDGDRGQGQDVPPRME
jgi:hypothetical protein